MANFNCKVSDDVILEAVRQHGSNAKAATALGLNRRGVDKRILNLAKRGYSPNHDMTHTVPEGFTVKGVSTLYDADNNVKAQWVKSNQTAEDKQVLLRELFDSLAAELPKFRAGKCIEVTNKDLAQCYVITDYHLGLLSWGEETGVDWDLKIAENMLIRWFDEALSGSRAVNAEIGIFAQLGDFMHWDGMDAVTPAAKNLLDADTRFQKLVRAAIFAIRHVINEMLKKHKMVIVIMAEGNHDPASSVWLREGMAALFQHEPRVIVNVSPDPYYCYVHGKTSLFFHHGHKRRPANIDHVFVAKYREVFGKTTHSYAHLGHMHHVDIKETNLMIVEQHRTLAAPDAYTSRGGWISGRDSKVITYHKEYGEWLRTTITPDMLGSK